MKDFFNKYKSIILPLILLLIFAACTALTWGKWGHIIYDCFREAVVPQALLDGKVLYRDITNLYPPLAYQFNALLFLIFGNSLNTLYWAGIINSLLILSIIYYIVKKYSSDLTAFITVFSIMEIFTFKMPYTTASWFFPYSYSFIYAFSACLLGFLFYVLYKENSKNKYLFLSFFFAGLSVAFKLDFTLFILLPLFEAFKSKNIKTVLKGLSCYLLPIFACISTFLLMSGFKTGLEALVYEAKFLNNFAHAPSVVVYNKVVMPQSLNFEILKAIALSFTNFVLISLILFTYTYFSLHFLSKIKNLILKALYCIVVYIFGYSFIITCIALYQFNNFSIGKDFTFLSHFVLISAVLIFISKLIKNKGVKGICFTNSEKFYLLASLFALLISFRCFCAIYISCIGNFILTIWWCSFIYLFLEILPAYFPRVFTKEHVKNTLKLFFIAFGLYFTFIFFLNTSRTTYKIESPKGTLYSTLEQSTVINDTIKFIKENIPEDKTLLISEEGLLFNYLTDRKTNLKYYALIPHMVDAFGEENIIKDLSENPPDYIFITNNNYMTEAGGLFGINYAKKIMEHILKNYDYITTMQNPNANPDIVLNHEFKIYKLKEN